ncbi:hydroxyethylthiazole kinase [Anaerosphaera multitolerans]|uniref:Hydroxyethylthiazole kinase n=1 Tax=Anaerosphaera multitolerans TaxID=2487351 RepID=A0A437S4V3_9FIRM|nr:hydroxyethylthiazole kinase [Anaerosphaera multitolerans]RVU53987.1 hydroxyethylthiazole kinase [Anaerosphaera multitolerans]
MKILNEVVEIQRNIREQSPLIECITNFVTVNDVANSILAIGASPIMADAKEEIEEIVKISKALYINIGTLQSTVIESMYKAQSTAQNFNKPIVIDAVGAGASKLRNKTVDALLNKGVDIVHGNYSEISYIGSSTTNTKGVDASDLDSDVDIISISKNVAVKFNCVCIATGKRDIVTDGNNTYIIYNGCSEMSSITGTGCMLTGLAASAAAVSKNHLAAALLGTALTSIAGERAKENSKGLGDFHINILNELSTINAEILRGDIKIEKY